MNSRPMQARCFARCATLFDPSATAQINLVPLSVLSLLSRRGDRAQRIQNVAGDNGREAGPEGPVLEKLASVVRCKKSATCWRRLSNRMCSGH
jgi:hypothetical protein